MYILILASLQLGHCVLYRAAESCLPSVAALTRYRLSFMSRKKSRWQSVSILVNEAIRSPSAQQQNHQLYETIPGNMHAHESSRCSIMAWCHCTNKESMVTGNSNFASGFYTAWHMLLATNQQTAALQLLWWLVFWTAVTNTITWCHSQNQKHIKYYYIIRTEPQPQVTGTKNLVKFERAVFEVHE